MNESTPGETLSSTTAHIRPKLVIVASPRARSEPSSPLLRLVRDYSDILREYEIHTTQGTSRIILSTGMYKQDDVNAHRAGKDGGIAELAAMVACGDCVAAILLLEPSDPWSDAVENRALKRVCIQRQVRLITTYAAAIRWAVYEASLRFTAHATSNISASNWKPDNWKLGIKNITEFGDFQQLKINQRSIALISHDKKKLEMVKFVNAHFGHLALHDRILTTGTTGWLLKLLYATESQLERFRQEIRKAGRESRLSSICADLLKDMDVVAPQYAGLDELLNRLKGSLKVSPSEDFATKVMPLPSGPEGGDVLIANEVLNNQCHTMIFFHDPMTAHPHNDDIRLLEHTCQLPGVFAECVSDRQSADRWLEGLCKELDGEYDIPNPAQQLRQRWNLKEIVLVKRDDDLDSDTLGEVLARVTAGYLNQRIHLVAQETQEIRIGISWGWGSKHVLQELIKMDEDGLLEKPARLAGTVAWSPLIGIITSEITDREAVIIAEGFCNFYGGKVEGFMCAGFAREGAGKPEAVNNLICKLEEADIILTSAAPWDEDAALYKDTGLSREYFPPLPARPPLPSDAIGLISGVFLNEEGGEVRGDYSIVGLDYNGFQHAAKKGAVILMCGGVKRREAALAALRGGLVSVLITTHQTAEWILQHSAGGVAPVSGLRQMAHGG